MVITRSMVQYGRRTVGVPFRGASINRRSTVLGKRTRTGRTVTRSTQTRNRYTSGQGVTGQYDRKTVYRKKSMPRYRKRRWRRFLKRVAAVSEKDLGTQTVVMNINATPQNQTTQKQLLWDCALYSHNSSITYWSDLDYIADKNANATGSVGNSTTDTTGLKISPSTKIIFKSAILDLTIRNASTQQTSQGLFSFNSVARMEVDIYECSVRRSDEEGVVYNDLIEMLKQNIARTEAIGEIGATNEIDIDKRGVTPWDCAYALSNFGIKIWKKTKYTLANNEQMTYQMRDPRRHVMNQRKLSSFEGCADPNTRILLVIGKLAPGLPVGSSVGDFQEILQIGLTRKYFYKVDNYTEDRTYYANR